MDEGLIWDGCDAEGFHCRPKSSAEMNSVFNIFVVAFTRFFFFKKKALRLVTKQRLHNKRQEWQNATVEGAPARPIHKGFEGQSKKVMFCCWMYVLCRLPV